MAPSEIKINVSVQEDVSLHIIKLLAEELQQCYAACDEVAALLGVPPFPRNPEILKAIELLPAGLIITDG